MSISPLAPPEFPQLPAVRGVELATHAAGLRYLGRDDLLAAVVPRQSTIAATFTRSLCPAAPVEWSRARLESSGGTVRAIVCNAGNANAFTGAAGAAATLRIATTVAERFDVDAEQVYLASTGVIGEPMDLDAMTEGLDALGGRLLESGPATWRAAAEAIRTTDTFAKGSCASIGGTDANFVGIAKGSGMIAPDMATMLGFVFTDLPISAAVLQHALGRAVGSSFNRITVDSDTSTSDTVLLVATASSDDDPLDSMSDPRLDEVCDALGAVCLDLAHQIVRDGEGATKFVKVDVTGAADDSAAGRIALSIANSPLVKTAVAAEDANWGRIVMAVGKAGERADRDQLSIWIGDEQVAAGGMVHEHYDEERATRHLRSDEVALRVDVGVGDGEATVWTCDLTHGYIDINAGYRS